MNSGRASIQDQSGGTLRASHPVWTQRAQSWAQPDLGVLLVTDREIVGEVDCHGEEAKPSLQLVRSPL